jgi:putative anti-sigma factor
VETSGIVVKEVDIRKYIDWTNGDFVFSDDRLEDVMNKLVLWYDCDVVYADEELKEIRLSGDMKRYGEVEEFLHFLKISTGAHFSVKNKTIVVSIK